MKKQIAFFLGAIIFMVISLPSTANATVRTFQFSGPITQGVGTSFVATLTYDDSQSPYAIDIANSDHKYDTFTFEIVVDGTTTYTNGGAIGTNHLGVNNFHSPTFSFDRFYAQSTNLTAGFVLYDPTATVFDSNNLPSVLSLSSFTGPNRVVVGGAPGGTLVGTISTIQQVYSSPVEMIAELITSVDESDIHKGTKNSLISSLENALKSLEKGNTGAAINQLQAFINKVEAQSGKEIDETTADQWIADAQEIIDAIQESLAKNGNGEELTFNEVKPENYSLNQNYPNPFNPTTSVSYSIPSDGYVTLSIYDALGKEVAVLDNGFRTAGNYSHTFDASNLSSGMYFYTIRSGNFVQTKKMLLMK